jgi:hypothetical protein
MVLSAAALAEAATGLALILFPAVVIWLLFAADLSPVGIVIARLAGICLLALSAGCWVGRQEKGRSAALASMLIYNILAAGYFLFLGLRGELVGILLWPAAVFHLAVSLLLGTANRVTADDVR